MHGLHHDDIARLLHALHEHERGLVRRWRRPRARPAAHASAQAAAHATEWLSRQDELELVPVLVGMLDAPHPLTRRTAAQAIGRFDAPAAARSALLRTATADPDVRVRAAALAAAGRYPGADVRRCLGEGLHHPSWRVKNAAAAGLLAQRDAAAVHELRAALHRLPLRPHCWLLCRGSLAAALAALDA